MIPYQAVWARLKAEPDKPVVLQIHQPKLMPRVKKGVIRAKHKDVGFKLLNELEYCWLEFEWDVGKNQLRIELKRRYGLVELVV